jgi:mono/diheme cytochrome c family protein
MKKFLTLSAVLGVIMIAAYFSACNNDKKEPVAKNNSDSLQKVLKRGEYLAHHVAACLDCHSQRDMTKYSGPVIPGTEGGGGFAFTEKIGIPGTVYGRNITPDPETGIGTWTDDEVLRAVTQGISKNGDSLFPLMPYVSFNRMAKEDLLSIIAYIRTLKPIKNAVPKRQLMAPMAMVYPTNMLQPSIEGNVRPAETDKEKYGEYLATMADCAVCHSPMTPHGPDMSQMFSGGYLFDLGTFKVNSANITPDSATGIGTWTEERFLTKFIPYREEKNYNFKVGRENTIMPLSEYAGMTDNDLKAIYAYLRTVRPIKHQVEKYPK